MESNLQDGPGFVDSSTRHPVPKSHNGSQEPNIGDFALANYNTTNIYPSAQDLPVSSGVQSRYPMDTYSSPPELPVSSGVQSQYSTSFRATGSANTQLLGPYLEPIHPPTSMNLHPTSYRETGPTNASLSRPYHQPTYTTSSTNFYPRSFQDGWVGAPIGPHLQPTHRDLSTNLHSYPTNLPPGSDAGSQSSMPFGHDVYKLQFAFDTLAERFNTLQTEVREGIGAMNTQFQILHGDRRQLENRLKEWCDQVREGNTILATTLDA